jgi:signal transduction histidine kinase
VSLALGLGGWLLAVGGLGVAALVRIRFSRHAEAVARGCHEVRGPLTAVRLGLELGARFSELSQTRLQAIELELGRAAVALDELSAVRARRTELDAQPVDLGELVASSVEAWRAVASAQGATISLEPPPWPVVVTGERLRLAQAIGNLLANGIEHGGGAVEVTLRTQGRVVRVEVVDGGPGLPAPIHRLIRRAGGRGRPERGHGLRVVRDVASAHGGRLVGAPSRRGARMVLELPGARGADGPVRP